MGNPDDSAWGEPYVPPPPVEPLIYHSVNGTARIASFFIGVWSIISLIGLFIDFRILLAMGNSIADTPTLTKAEVESLASQESVLAILAMSVYAVGAIFFLRWTYLAANNAQVLSPARLRFSRASAVWWWFVPFMNFWKPYQAMSEIWNASSGGHQHGLRGACDAADRCDLVGQYYCNHSGGFVGREQNHESRECKRGADALPI